MALIQSSQASNALDYWHASIRVSIRPEGRRDFAITALSRIARNSEYRLMRRLAALRLQEIETKERAAS